MPELHLQYQVEPTAEGRLVKGQSGKPSAGVPKPRGVHRGDDARQ
jgi:hypothetical protein